MKPKRMGVMDLPVKLGTVLPSPNNVLCSYVPFHSVLNKLVSEESAVLHFGRDAERE